MTHDHNVRPAQWSRLSRQAGAQNYWTLPLAIKRCVQLAEIDTLDTNLLTVTNGQTLLGQTAELPEAAPGTGATLIYAQAKHWSTAISAEAWAGGTLAVLFIGAIAELLPAIKAARMSPTQALWSV